MSGAAGAPTLARNLREHALAAAYIEHRPKSTDKEATVSHYVIVTGGEEKHGSFKTQHEAKDKACAEGYRLARVRHLHDNPDHFRKDPC